jgi:hypothetical protein
MRSEFTPPLRKIVKREDGKEILECGHEQPKKYAAAVRRRCIQCRRARVTVSEKAEAEAGQRCPYCFDEFSNSEEQPWTCPKCHTRLHGECHDENDGCTTLGCYTRAPVSVRPRITPTQIPPPTVVERAAATVSRRHGIDVVLTSVLIIAFVVIPILMWARYGFFVGVAMAVGTSYVGATIVRWRKWLDHHDRGGPYPHD